MTGKRWLALAGLVLVAGFTWIVMAFVTHAFSCDPSSPYFCVELTPRNRAATLMSLFIAGACFAVPTLVFPLRARSRVAVFALVAIAGAVGSGLVWGIRVDGCRVNAPRDIVGCTAAAPAPPASSETLHTARGLGDDH